MYINHEFIEAMKKQREQHKYLLENGVVTFWNEYGEEYNKVVIKFISCEGKSYYIVENYAGEVIELRLISDIT